MSRTHFADHAFRSYFRRKSINYLMCGLCVAAAVIVLMPLLSIFGYVISEGARGLNLGFFTHLPQPVGELGGGMANALLGTTLLVGAAAIVGIPWGIATGMFLSEYGAGRKAATVVRFSVDMLASVPSIVVGLFAYTILVLPLGHFSGFAGSAALTIIIIPTVARVTEEILKMIPENLREAGLALGIPRWKVVVQIILRAARRGLATGVMLSLARVAGETAPLLFTALNNRFWTYNMTQPMASIPVQIYTYAISPFEDWHRQAWAGALILVFGIFILNLLTRLILLPLARSRN